MKERKLTVLKTTFNEALAHGAACPIACPMHTFGQIEVSAYER